MSRRHVTETVTLQTYTLEVTGPPVWGFAEGIILPLLLRSALLETKENLTDLLPEGYSVRIREWDAKEETPNE